MSKQSVSLETIVALAKRRGFVFPTSSIYGGLANSYDYGPVGVELLRNIRQAWWQSFITNREDMVGIDSQIILHPDTWVASGHVGSFSDPLVEDLVTHKRYRADHLIEEWAKLGQNSQSLTKAIEDLSLDELTAFIEQHRVLSPDGNPVSAPKAFNLLFETAIGAVSGEKSKTYLRGETAQGIFTNFKNILDSSRVQLPFGVGQLGKSFRNEVTTGQFVFRTLEFEQGEIEYFFNPQQSEWRQLMDEWKRQLWSFVTYQLGINPDHLRWRKHSPAERSHYSLETYDLEYQYSFGWKELWGLAYRTDFDLKQQMTHSGKSLEYVDSQTGDKFIPHVIEPAVGINRIFLMILTDAYSFDASNQRVVLKITPQLAPYKVAVFPLLKNKPELVAAAREIYQHLRSKYPVAWDERGNIGKRYLAQDEIGTPYCVTIDFQTLEDDSVTVRHRDTTQQERVPYNKLIEFLNQQLESTQSGMVLAST